MPTLPPNQKKKKSGEAQAPLGTPPPASYASE